MNFSAAASLGLNLLQNSTGLSSAVTSALGKKVTSGQSFGKIAQQIGLTPQVIQQAENLLQNVANKGPTSGTQVLAAMQFFDQDRNGQLSTQEIQAGLEKLEASGQAKAGLGAQWHHMGTQLLAKYNQVAQLDADGASISYRDMGKLMAQDNAQNNLSRKDWETLS